MELFPLIVGHHKQKYLLSLLIGLFIIQFLTGCRGNVSSIQIVFTSGEGDDVHIMGMSADGTNIMRLTTRPGYYRCPVWSPDGDQIAFVERIGYSSKIFIMNFDGSNLTQIFEDEIQIFDLDWSPDGQRLVFSASEGSPPEIFILDISSSDMVQLTNDNSSDYAPLWSPDGNQILFSSDRNIHLGNKMYLMDSSGSNITLVTSSVVGETPYAWSSDGKMIIYGAGTEGTNNIYIHKVDGSDEIQLTNHKGIPILQGISVSSGSADFSPDDNQIVFTSNRDSESFKYLPDNTVDIYIMDVDGTNIIRLTELGNTGYPRWRPK